jgi:hypothetical protein
LYYELKRKVAEFASFVVSQADLGPITPGGELLRVLCWKKKKSPSSFRRVRLLPISFKAVKPWCMEPPPTAPLSKQNCTPSISVLLVVTTLLYSSTLSEW